MMMTEKFSGSDSDNKDIADKKKIFHRKIKSVIQWYVRNKLFQKLKLLVMSIWRSTEKIYAMDWNFQIIIQKQIVLLYPLTQQEDE